MQRRISPSPLWRLRISPIGSQGLCALRLAQRLRDPVPAGNCKLQTLRQYYRLPERGAHTAFGDVQTVVDLFAQVLRPIAEHRDLDTWEKLAAYAGERRKITRADVALLVVSDKKYEVWDLADMLAARQPAQALEFLDSLLRNGEQAVALLGGLAWMYRKLLEAQELPRGIYGGQAAGMLKMRKEQAELALRECRKFPKAQLAKGLEALYEADSRLKSGSWSQRTVMEFLVAQLASEGRA